MILLEIFKLNCIQNASTRNFVRLQVMSHDKNPFYCVSDLNNSTINPRPFVNYYEARKICELENTSLITSLEPNFDFERQISNFFDFDFERHLKSKNRVNFPEVDIWVDLERLNKGQFILDGRCWTQKMFVNEHMYIVTNILKMSPTICVVSKRTRIQSFIKDRNTAKVYEMLYNETMRAMEFNGLHVLTKEWVMDHDPGNFKKLMLVTGQNGH